MSQATATTPPAVDVRIKALRRFAMSITAFNVIGHLFLGFEQAYLTPIVALATAYLVSMLLESIDAWAGGRRARFRGSFVDLVNFLLPAHIAALACAMLLYGNDRLLPTIFATTVAVSGKYIFRVRVRGSLRHMLNPSNFGISVTLLTFSWVAIAPPYHFTEYGGKVVDWAVPVFILIAGTMLNGKLTNRLPLIAGWIGGFALQAVLRTVLFDDALTSTLLSMTGVAFILFTNYMITDPGTTPFAARDQVAFGVATALVYGALVAAHITFGLFYALTIVCATRLVLTWLRERGVSVTGLRTREQKPVPAAPAPADPVPVPAVASARPAP